MVDHHRHLWEGKFIDDGRESALRSPPSYDDPMPAAEDITPTSHAPDARLLSEIKNGTSISVCLPARNEQSTIGPIVESIRQTLMTDPVSGQPGFLVDEILVMDDSSTDNTAAVATRAGANVVSVADVLPECGPGAGKGNVLWKSVAACTGDIIVWIDADLTSFNPGFVTGLLGPLLADQSIAMVKGFYHRPQSDGVGGGRTTEIMARPLISTFFPHLAHIRQPLGGEYASRRRVLEELPFCEGYGVETGLLIDIARRHGTAAIAQVDLGTRTHRIRPLHDLTAQSMEVLHAAVARAPGIEWSDAWGSVLDRPDRPPVEVLTGERPPLTTCAGYHPAPSEASN